MTPAETTVPTVNILVRGYGRNEITLHQRPNYIEVNNYVRS